MTVVSVYQNRADRSRSVGHRLIAFAVPNERSLLRHFQASFGVPASDLTEHRHKNDDFI